MEKTKNNSDNNIRNVKNILIIDTDKELKYKVKNYLENNKIKEKYDIDFLFAENLNEAFKVMQNEKIDLIILEIILPLINGFYFLNFIDKEKKDIPIIIYTKLKESQDLKKAAEKGNIVNIFVKQLSSMDEIILKIVNKEYKADEISRVIEDIESKIKSIDESKIEKSLKILQCPKCHIILAKNSRFCNNCGQKILNIKDISLNN